jgi:hypothetical protein
MNAVAMITPEPKNLANVKQISGICNAGSFFADMGNKAPKVRMEQVESAPNMEVARMTKTAAMCKPNRPSKSFPPPQMGE